MCFRHLFPFAITAAVETRQGTLVQCGPTIVSISVLVCSLHFRTGERRSFRPVLRWLCGRDSGGTPAVEKALHRSESVLLDGFTLSGIALLDHHGANPRHWPGLTQKTGFLPVYDYVVIRSRDVTYEGPTLAESLRIVRHSYGGLLRNGG